MKLNHMICPTCGHDFYVDCAYGTCDACNTHFYAAQSKTKKPTMTLSTPFVPYTSGYVQMDPNNPNIVFTSCSICNDPCCDNPNGKH